MNSFDVGIAHFFNKFMNHWPLFDDFMNRIVDSAIVKGIAILLVAWYLLFDRDEEGHPRPNVESLWATILLSPFAIVLTRVFAYLMPFRVRPVWTPEIHFQTPAGFVPVLHAWSSFPSDHAVLFFMLATGIYFASRALGVFALLWTALLICFPRVYLGFHWPTDVLAGALIGAAAAWITRIPAIQAWSRRWMVAWREHQPGLFMVWLFFISYEISQLFSNTKVANWLVVRLTGH